MTVIRIFSLGVSVILLSACGSDSKDNDQVNNYDLTPYEGRNVNPSSLEGTWVAIGYGTRRIVTDEKSTTINSASKEYFVIRETDTGYEKAKCGSGFENITINGEQIIFQNNEITGTIIENNKIIAEYNNSSISMDSVYGAFKTFNMVKISNEINPIGTVNTTDNENLSSIKDVFCFKQSNEDYIKSSYNGIRYKYSLSQDNTDRFNIFVTLWIGQDASKDIYIHNGYNYSTTDNEKVEFSIDSETDTSLSISFEGANTDDSMIGTIEIQLP